MYKVLLVDDEPLIVEGLKHIISWDELGLEIAGQCSGGLQALDFIGKNKVDIVITDIKMPGINGIDLIRRLKAAYDNLKYIVLSGYDDFEFVKEAAFLGIENYLLKPVVVDELVSTLTNTITKFESELYRKLEFRDGLDILKENILNRWLSGNIEKEEFAERSQILGLNIGKTNFVAAVTKIIYDPQKMSLHKTREKKLIRFAVLNICSQTVSINGNTLCFSDFKGDIAVIYSNEGKECDLKAIHDRLASCVKSMNDLLDIDVFITVGSVEKDFEDLHLSYERAKDLQEYQMILPANSLVFYDEVARSGSRRKMIVEFDINRLHDLISTKNRPEAIRYVEDIYTKMSGSDMPDIRFVRDTTIEILYNAKLALSKLSQESDIFFDELGDLYSGISGFQSIHQLQDRVKDIILRVIDFWEQSSANTSPFIRMILDYVNNNYSQDINLKSLAAKYNLSPVYLGFLFKKETGDVFTCYLNKIRIEAARKLLSDPNAKANEVAQKVGYSNINYFYTLFKKMVGVSTSEYQHNGRYML